MSQVSRDSKAAATKAVLQQLHLLQDAREEAEQVRRIIIMRMKWASDHMH